MSAPSERHLLTVLHAAERTGPPLFALRFLRWLHEQRPGWRTDTLFLDGGGDLLGAFEALGRVVVRERSSPAGQSWTAARMADRGVRRRVADLGRPDLVHVHCAGSMRAVPMLPDAPLLCHVHELSVGLDYHLDPGARSNIDRADHYVAVSDAVRTEFVERFQVDPARIERQWGFVDREALEVRPDRAALGAADDRFVVVGSGLRHWRKGPELFLRVAHRAVQLHPDRPWRFVWVGGGSAHGGADAYERLATESGLGDVVRFIDHVEDPLPLIAAGDVFLLTAREDAFPLVCVEAAALGRPLVSFDSGGTPELIRAADCGRVVRFPDVDGVVEALDRLAADPAERERLGKSAAAFATANLVLDARGPQLLATLETVMDRAARP